MTDEEIVRLHLNRRREQLKEPAPKPYAKKHAWSAPRMTKEQRSIYQGIKVKKPFEEQELSDWI